MALTKRKVKYSIAVLLVAIVLILVFQNSDNTTIRFLIFEKSLPTLVVILGSFLVGVFVGFVVRRRR